MRAEDAPKAREISEQDWGLALLFSVEPTDRALAGWSGNRLAPYLMRLAEVADGRRLLPVRRRR